MAVQPGGGRLRLLRRRRGDVHAARGAGEGVGWHEHDHRLYSGTERFFRPGYQAHLVAEWIPALEGVEEKLRAGAKVADVGCGHGASTVIMAAAYPSSRFTGIDYHDASIARAREIAAEEGVADRCTFEVRMAQAGPKRTMAVLEEAGFSRVRVAAEAGFNLIYEARP